MLSQNSPKTPADIGPVLVELKGAKDLGSITWRDICLVIRDSKRPIRVQTYLEGWNEEVRKVYFEKWGPQVGTGWKTGLRQDLLCSDPIDAKPHQTFGAPTEYHIDPNRRKNSGLIRPCVDRVWGGARSGWGIILEECLSGQQGVKTSYLGANTPGGMGAKGLKGFF